MVVGKTAGVCRSLNVQISYAVTNKFPTTRKSVVSQVVTARSHRHNSMTARAPMAMRQCVTVADTQEVQENKWRPTDTLLTVTRIGRPCNQTIMTERVGRPPGLSSGGQDNAMTGRLEVNKMASMATAPSCFPISFRSPIGTPCPRCHA